MRRVLACAITAATSLAFTSAALGGTISGQVFRDYNSNAVKNAGGYVVGSSAAATDVGMGGLTVRAFDNAGNQVGETTTAGDGTYSLPVSASGTVRVEFSTPTGFQPSFKGAEAETSVQFVDAAGASNVNYAVNVPGEYCQDNPDLVSCMAPYLSFAGMIGAFTFPSAFSAAMDPIAANGGVPDPSDPSNSLKGGTTVNTSSVLGATFGVGTDRNGNAYYGTYVKRHSPYAASNTARRNVVYKVNVATGTQTAFVTLGTEVLPAHDARIASGTNGGGNPWPAYAVDGLRSDAAGQAGTDVYHQVGRAGLGDVDVSPDGSTLWAVEMTESAPQLWKVPIEGSGAGTTAGTPTAYPITAPTTFGSGSSAVTCEGTWHPMGIGISGMGDQMLVGGICGAENTTPKLGVATYASSVSSVATLEFTNDAAIDNISVGDRINVNSWKPASGTWWNWGTFPNGNEVRQWSPGLVEVTGKTTIAGGGVSSLSFAIPASWGDLPRTQLGINPGFTPGSQTSVFKSVVPNAFIMSFDQSTGAFSTVYGFSMGYPKTGTSHKSVPAVQSLRSNMWQSWYDGRPSQFTFCAYNSGENPEWCRGTPPQWGKPMLANIEINADGSLTIGFRDRMADQSAANTVDYESPSVTSPRMQADPSTAVAETLQICNTGSGYALESAGRCGSKLGANVPNILLAEPQAIRDAGPLYWDNGLFLAGGGVPHPYASLGGTARMPGVDVLWSTTYDVTNILSQGVRAMGPCAAGDTTCGPRPANDGALLGGSDLDTSNQPTYCGTRDSCWAKGNGLGDLEVLCDAAPLQIGNRVWIDTNQNGLQDPGETPVAGVTVRLYDAGGTLVGTAKTDAQGQYYFASDVTKPAGGDGTNTGGGLVPGQAFTIRLDNPADFTGSGPLAPYVLTKVDVATAPAGAQPTLINSKASKVDGYPQISVGARRAGFNNHTFDVGFIDPTASPGGDPNANAATTPVGMGDYTWIDSNRNGIQDAGESPLPGVRVQLLNPDGSVARDFNGNPVGPVTTDARGYYLITNLRAGSYTARFTIPNGYAFTVPGAGTPGTDSNPTSFSANGLVGTTPVFQIYASAFGTTTPFANDPKALFANLTVDAGVVPLVAIGNFVWFDSNRDGVQGKNEKPVKGAKVYLLNPNGSRARDASGKPVKVATTDAKGRYLFQGLLPGDYRVKFVFPKGYTGTIAGKGTSKNGSNPKVSPLTPRVGLTSTFRVFDAARGNTVRQTDPKVNAKFIDPTIDAGLILYGGGPRGVVG